MNCTKISIPAEFASKFGLPGPINTNFSEGDCKTDELKNTFGDKTKIIGISSKGFSSGRVGKDSVMETCNTIDFTLPNGRSYSVCPGPFEMIFGNPFNKTNQKNKIQGDGFIRYDCSFSAEEVQNLINIYFSNNESIYLNKNKVILNKSSNGSALLPDTPNKETKL